MDTIEMTTNDMSAMLETTDLLSFEFYGITTP